MKLSWKKGESLAACVASWARKCITNLRKMFHSYTWKRGGGKDRSVNAVKKIFMNLILISHNLHQKRRTFPFDGIYTSPRLSNIQLHDQISDFLLTHLLIFPVTLLFEHHMGALSEKIQLEKSCSNLFKCLQKFISRSFIRVPAHMHAQIASEVKIHIKKCALISTFSCPISI